MMWAEILFLAMCGYVSYLVNEAEECILLEIVGKDMLFSLFTPAFPQMSGEKLIFFFAIDLSMPILNITHIK